MLGGVGGCPQQCGPYPDWRGSPLHAYPKAGGVFAILP